jgi:hypothetical protein
MSKSTSKSGNGSNGSSNGSNGSSNGSNGSHKSVNGSANGSNGENLATRFSPVDAPLTPEDCFVKANQIWGEMAARRRTNLEDACNIGHFLTHAFNSSGAKKVKPFVEKKFDGGYQTALDYMNVATYWRRVKRCKTIEEAKKVISAVKRAAKKAAGRGIDAGQPAGGHAVNLPKDCGIINGDLGVLWDKLEDGKTRLFLTDPLYEPEHVEVYGRIAELAASKLTDDGLLVAYAGKLNLPEVIRQLGRRHLKFYWVLAIPFVGRPNWLKDQNVTDRWRLALIYHKGQARPERPFTDLIQGSGGEKEHGDHQQNAEEATRIIKMFTDPGDLIVDPCAGFGSFLVAALSTNRRWLGTELLKDRVKIARDRLRTQAAEMAGQPAEDSVEVEEQVA